jgi:hypothetical protein
MRQRIKNTLHILLITVLLLVAAVPGFTAEVRRVPSKNLVEQGFLALALYARLGREDFKDVSQSGETLYWYNHDTKSQENRGNLYVFVKNGRVSRIVIAYQ